MPVNCQDLRRQHDEQVAFYKEELEQTFQAKVGVLLFSSFRFFEEACMTLSVFPSWITLRCPQK